MLILIHFLIVLIFSPLLLGIIGKTKAFFAGRWGAPLLQPYYDIFKLFSKGNVYSVTTTWIFQAAPLLSFVCILVSCLVLPFGGIHAPCFFWGDVLLFAGLYTLARFVMVIAALDTGSSFEGMGAAREATFSCLAECCLFLNFIVLALLSKKLILSQMVGGDLSVSWWTDGPALILVGGSYFMVLLTENARIPVDDPQTHLELTMIHEARVLDHSGWDFAFILYGSAIKLFVLGGLLVDVLLPLDHQPVLIQMGEFFVGMVILAMGIGCVESSMARLRLNRIPQLLTGSFILALVGFLVVLIRGV
ncbi:MAG: NADH-quinone oxidoreductase subunit H [Candidatus Omnitrophica bacterium]|nr:NADH-quinone oxidoreductase subunit H [Candidatus Omnitrophota bacterium]